tara:strand:+ start:580 stop:999 length:420 start_codon:yes stop_codon:yes gene_type:complete
MHSINDTDFYPKTDRLPHQIDVVALLDNIDYELTIDLVKGRYEVWQAGSSNPFQTGWMVVASGFIDPLEFATITKSKEITHRFCTSRLMGIVRGLLKDAFIKDWRYRCDTCEFLHIFARDVFAGSVDLMDKMPLAAYRK